MFRVAYIVLSSRFVTRRNVTDNSNTHSLRNVLRQTVPQVALSWPFESTSLNAPRFTFRLQCLLQRPSPAYCQGYYLLSLNYVYKFIDKVIHLSSTASSSKGSIYGRYSLPNRWFSLLLIPLYDQYSWLPDVFRLKHSVCLSPPPPPPNQCAQHRFR